MAEIKVSQLPEATQINDNDLLMIVQGGTNKKITKDNSINVGLATKQDTLVSGTNIKTINSTSILGEGDISITGTQPVNQYSTNTNEAYSCNFMNGKIIEESNESTSSGITLGYIKYGNGTLVCYGSNTNNAGDNNDYWGQCRRIDDWGITFPVEFTATPSITCNGNYEAMISCNISSASSTGMVVRILTWSNSSSSSCYRCFTAIGKWK